MNPALFQNRLLEWFHREGRKNLPWQHPRTPYRVWVSEVMLQQTQVTTVIPYFEKFMHLFPSISHLAAADQDTVLSLWAGLGYYARGRHLHQTAQLIMQKFKGIFPQNIALLETLPGIGRSTAGAILSLGFNQAAPILDGNVRRVLCRLHAIEGLPSENKTLKQLWMLAERYTSPKEPANYTQAIMDLGSLICTRRNPRCVQCPFQSSCRAFLNQKTHYYPRPKHTQTLPLKETIFLVLINPKGKILLERRPPTGIWGGLWSIPECLKETDLANWCTKQYHCRVHSTKKYPAIKHTFSHFHLSIHPILCDVSTSSHILKDSASYGWFDRAECQEKGMAAPIKKLLTSIFSQQVLLPDARE